MLHYSIWKKNILDILILCLLKYQFKYFYISLFLAFKLPIFVFL